MVATECNVCDKHDDDCSIKNIMLLSDQQPDNNVDCCSDSVSCHSSQLSSNESSLVYKFNENLYYGTRGSQSSNPTLMSDCVDQLCCKGDGNGNGRWSDQSTSLCFCNKITDQHLNHFIQKPLALTPITPSSGLHSRSRHHQLRKKLLKEQLCRFQVLQTYATVKYILMVAILASIVDGLFILGYQQQFIRDLLFRLWFRRMHRSMFSPLSPVTPLSDFSRLVLFDEQRLRVATGSLYLINVFIQFVGLFGVNGDRLLITSSYAIYSCLCFLFTIGAYVTYRRLIVSLSINAVLAILSIMFAIFIKKFEHIRFNRKTFSV